MKIKSQSTNKAHCADLLPKPDPKRVVKVAQNRWRDIPWRKLERKVWKLQKRIYQASRRVAQLSDEIEVIKQKLATANKQARRREYREAIPRHEANLSNANAEKAKISKKIRLLQKLLMKSRAAKLLATRRVTQENLGKKTAGVDGVKALSPRQRWELAKELRIDGKAMPTRRKWINKPGKQEKRPLGIPVMRDRAKQKLAELALDPEWEARFEPNSYGFRKGRSCHDAIKAIWDCICQRPKWVLDADIAKCFDRINHSALLQKLNTTPALSRQIKAWLRGGVLDDMKYFDTNEGTPQGGVISPLLANVALHGMENRIKQAFPLKTIEVKGKYAGSINPAQLIRYADDLLIIHDDLEVIQQAQKIVAEHLNGVGLEWNPKKTRITHTLGGGEEYETGFDFLGWSIRQLEAGKNQEYNASKKKVKRYDRLGFHFHTVITPSKKKVQAHLEKLHSLVLVGKAKAMSQAALIKGLNSVIRGWANYNRTINSKETFSKLDSLLFKMLWRWAVRRHPKWGKKRIKNRYWPNGEGSTRNWEFIDKKSGTSLLKYADTKVISPMTKDQYVKVVGDRSPYDENVAYWAARLGEHPELSLKLSKFLKRQKGKCTHCGLDFRHGDQMEIHHIDGCHHNNKWNNLSLVHLVCHDRIHGENYYDDGIKESWIDRKTRESLGISKEDYYREQNS